ncbi:uncharacterized protein BDZ99DRAFT_280816 [Mytilinidion resinicola]|uniref:Uncharacterized protein n=1 Tax=Mytilinidion resinicola TaxID=574789 RepID=A0A6A6YV11_9PEZI|nr:uncharacterized protein BDZ99DRAFT_280816 [Mytilinidion resinicola]KAF2811797.1 hypothetical protein BDZ99DRAFT_280816 [Mytilinidion resinicola]
MTCLNELAQAELQDNQRRDRETARLLYEKDASQKRFAHARISADVQHREAMQNFDTKKKNAAYAEKQSDAKIAGLKKQILEEAKVKEKIFNDVKVLDREFNNTQRKICKDIMAAARELSSSESAHHLE